MEYRTREDSKIRYFCKTFTLVSCCYFYLASDNRHTAFLYAKIAPGRSFYKNDTSVCISAFYFISDHDLYYRPSLNPEGYKRSDIMDRSGSKMVQGFFQKEKSRRY